ncbi:7383_t:CDS:1 [Funneliformis caledonium]|uniref:7383_t:CDS:1 n=1 Tax=Funneliformis caledonium TaxID=1117310 RepID=A0A9N9NDU0_9GLOM|nr:7383_t:CDS:1 [Funneliformis caledonium]
MQHQLQQGNTCLDYPQLNQEQNYSFAINGYESTPSPMTGLTSLDVQHQLQQDDTYFHNSSYSVNPPLSNQEQNHFFAINGYESTPFPFSYSVNPPRFNQEQNYSFTTNGYESTPSSLTGLTSLDVQHHLRQGNTCLDDSYSVNQPQLSQEQHYFSDARFR